MSHFKRDCVPVTQAAMNSNQVFINCSLFVLLSIQQPLWGLPAQYKDVQNKGLESVYLFGAKRAGLRYVQENVRALRNSANEAKEANNLDALIMAYLNVPCLGLAKASFLAQLTIGNGACLDVHNLRLLGLGEQALRLNKKLLPASQLTRVRAYNALWQAHGNSAHWWNTWCDNLAADPRNKFTNGKQVSAIHRLPIAA